MQFLYALSSVPWPCMAMHSLSQLGGTLAASSRGVGEFYIWEVGVGGGEGIDVYKWRGEARSMH